MHFQWYIGFLNCKYSGAACQSDMMREDTC